MSRPRTYASDPLLPVRYAAANVRSVTGTAIHRLGNPAVRMLDTAGSANWRFTQKQTNSYDRNLRPPIGQSRHSLEPSSQEKVRPGQR
jgi:hypothetical protein